MVELGELDSSEPLPQALDQLVLGLGIHGHDADEEPLQKLTQEARREM